MWKVFDVILPLFSVKTVFQTVAMSRKPNVLSFCFCSCVIKNYFYYYMCGWKMNMCSICSLLTVHCSHPLFLFHFLFFFLFVSFWCVGFCQRFPWHYLWVFFFLVFFYTSFSSSCELCQAKGKSFVWIFFFFVNKHLN